MHYITYIWHTCTVFLGKKCTKCRILQKNVKKFSESSTLNPCIGRGDPIQPVTVCLVVRGTQGWHSNDPILCLLVLLYYNASVCHSIWDKNWLRNEHGKCTMVCGSRWGCRGTGGGWLQCEGKEKGRRKNMIFSDIRQRTLQSYCV